MRVHRRHRSRLHSDTAGLLPPRPLDTDRVDLNLGDDEHVSGPSHQNPSNQQFSDDVDEGDHVCMGDKGLGDDQANQHDQNDQDEEFYANQEGSRGHGHVIGYAQFQRIHTQFRHRQCAGGVSYADAEQLELGN